MANSWKSSGNASAIVQSKLEEFFWEFLCLPESQKIVYQTVQFAKTGDANYAPAAPEATPAPPSPSFSGPSTRGSSAGRSAAPSPPGSPHNRASPTGRDGTEFAFPVGNDLVGATLVQPPSPSATQELPALTGGATQAVPPGQSHGTSREIPRFWWPKRMEPDVILPDEAIAQIHEHFERQNITEMRTYTQLESIVTDVFGLSRYFVAPIFYHIRVLNDLAEEGAAKTHMLQPSPEPVTEDMVVRWASGRIQIDDPVLSFFQVVKKDHNMWVEREDFSVFLHAILLTHPGLDFLRGTTEFQGRYADTVISRIFYVYDKKDVGRIYLPALRRYRPSIIETWKHLAEQDNIKMVRDYFSYEQFYVIYCTFWELDSDHDFLLDKDDLLKYDGHTLSRRAVDRIFSEIPTKFTSAVPGKMGYEDFIRFLLCDQDRQTERSLEYWFHLYDLDGDGCIRDGEMRYFYEEQVQRMECLNYETISFADIMCQMNDVINPKEEGNFRLAEFKRQKKFAGTFFSFFSSLNKFLNFEHRDPSATKQDQIDNPTFTDWDRWCADEYSRLALEEGEGEDDAAQDACE
eukprot:TRINITY_DN1350_c0_g2_i1.p1 TRINITY_DN1350_c0_g2~~TRINITY_DN1350_c0_g2_i1.p1  ORF type:complete len:574 (-),score=99.87 TRINITY_DN1350_c0_g2_i1:40-1761(-)